MADINNNQPQNNFKQKDQLNEQQKREQERMKDKAREPNEQNKMIHTENNRSN